MTIYGHTPINGYPGISLGYSGIPINIINEGVSVKKIKTPNGTLRCTLLRSETIPHVKINDRKQAGKNSSSASKAHSRTPRGYPGAVLA